MNYKALKMLLVERGYDILADMTSPDPGSIVYAVRLDNPLIGCCLGSQYTIGLYQFEGVIEEYLTEMLPQTAVN